MLKVKDGLTRCCSNATLNSPLRGGLQESQSLAASSALYLQRGLMQFFNISRINTDFGIFRVSGDWCFKRPEVENINVKSIEIMGTDGWDLLDICSESNSQLINNLLPLLLTHLIFKRSSV